MINAVAVEQCARDLFVLRRHGHHPVVLRPLAHVIDEAARDGHIAARFQEPGLRVDSRWQGLIVLVRSALLQAFVQRRCQAAIGAMKNGANPPVPGGVFTNNLRRCVAGSIIDDQEFEVRLVLSQDRFDRGAQRRAGIVNRHEDRALHVGRFI